MENQLQMTIFILKEEDCSEISRFLNLIVKELEETMLKSTSEQNDKYAECYSKLMNKLSNKKYINLKKIDEIIKAKVVSTRIKFALYDLKDLHKCNFCKKHSCKTCHRLKQCSKQ